MLVAVLAIASSRDEVLPNVEPLRIATAITMKLAPSEVALLSCSLVSTPLDFFLRYRRWRIARHRDCKRPGRWSLARYIRRSVDVQV